MLNVNKKQLTESLIVEWLEKLEYLDNKKREQLFKLGCSYYDAQNNFLYEIYGAILEKIYICKDNEKNLIYLYEKDKHILTYQNYKMEFTLAQIKEIIVGLIDILENIYPLGTIVELKKEFLKKVPFKKDVESVQVILINRFIGSNDAESFFHYAGAVYPIGVVEQKSLIYFTHALIEKVIFKGYVDEKEDAYVYLMKRELIINKNMHSRGFCTEKEEQDIQNKLG